MPGIPGEEDIDEFPGVQGRVEFEHDAAPAVVDDAQGGYDDLAGDGLDMAGGQGGVAVGSSLVEHVHLGGFRAVARRSSDELPQDHAGLGQEALGEAPGGVWGGLAATPVEGLGAANRGGIAIGVRLLAWPRSAPGVVSGDVSQGQADDARSPVVEGLGGEDEERDGVAGPMAGPARTVHHDDLAAVGDPRGFTHRRSSSVREDGGSGIPMAPRSPPDGRHKRPMGTAPFVNTGRLRATRDSSLSDMVIWHPCRSSLAAL